MTLTPHSYREESMATEQTQKKQRIKFNDKKNCTIISKCKSIRRITECLHFYQTLAQTDYGALLEYLNDDNYPFLLDDYHHILDRHLGDSKTRKHSNTQYEEIHNYIMQHLEECKLEKCNKLNRNNRNRAKQSVFANDENKNNTNDKENEAGGLLEFYIETLDTIHCLFVHTFDVGFRLRPTEIEQSLSLKRIKSIENEHEVKI